MTLASAASQQLHAIRLQLISVPALPARTQPGGGGAQVQQASVGHFVASAPSWHPLRQPLAAAAASFSPAGLPEPSDGGVCCRRCVLRCGVHANVCFVSDGQHTKPFVPRLSSVANPMCHHEVNCEV